LNGQSEISILPTKRGRPGFLSTEGLKRAKEYVSETTTSGSIGTFESAIYAIAREEKGLNDHEEIQCSPKTLFNLRKKCEFHEEASRPKRKVTKCHHCERTQLQSEFEWTKCKVKRCRKRFCSSELCLEVFRSHQEKHEMRQEKVNLRTYAVKNNEKEESVKDHCLDHSRNGGKSLLP
jgi:hypothetical protein